MGRETVTVQNVELVKVIEDRNLMLVKGAVPGNKGGLVPYPVCSKRSGQIRVLSERRKYEMAKVTMLNMAGAEAGDNRIK